MHTPTRITHDAPSLLTVQAPEDIEFLVKESEVLTGCLLYTSRCV